METEVRVTPAWDTVSRSTLASGTGGEKSPDCRPLHLVMKAIAEVVRRASVLD